MKRTAHFQFDFSGDYNQHLEQVLHRYVFKQAAYSKTTENLAKPSNVPEELVKLISLAFENIENFNAADYRAVSVPVLLDYLQRTHEYYQSYYFTKIDQSIDQLQQTYPDAEDFMDLLKVFFSDYQNDIFQHIAEEEEKLFPYIHEMLCIPSRQLKSSKRKPYSIENFQKQHDDENENALVQVIQMIKQQYPTAGFSPLNILLTQIELFEKDLRIHSRVEEEVLLPKAKKLERLIWR